MSKQYDAIIIGTGQSGPSLAARLAKEGMKVAIIERTLFGGTCVNTGCIPTKTLVSSARVAHVARRVEEFGLKIDGSLTVDMKRVKERKDGIVAKSNQGVENWLKGTENCTVYEGHGRFEDSHSIRVGEEVLEAEKIFINVGGRAFVPPFPGINDVQYLTNSGMMEVDFLPEHLIIIGGSYIALEFAQNYRRFGSQVTIIERASRLIQREDTDISEAVQDILENEGIEIRLDADCIDAQKDKDRVRVNLDCEKGAREVTGSHLLLAVGRVPNTDDLGLDKAGIETNDRGYIGVDDQLRTNVPGVWALGDCNGQGAFTHTSYNDYEIVAANLLDDDPRRLSDRILAYALYIDPPLGRVGMTEDQVRQSGRAALMANPTHDPGGPSGREGRNPGLHEDPGGCQDPGDPGSLRSGRGRRRSDPFSSGCHVRRRPLYRYPAGRPHPPHRDRVDTHHAG